MWAAAGARREAPLSCAALAPRLRAPRPPHGRPHFQRHALRRSLLHKGCVGGVGGGAQRCHVPQRRGDYVPLCVTCGGQGRRDGRWRRGRRGPGPQAAPSCIHMVCAPSCPRLVTALHLHDGKQVVQDAGLQLEPGLVERVCGGGGWGGEVMQRWAGWWVEVGRANSKPCRRGLHAQRADQAQRAQRARRAHRS